MDEKYDENVFVPAKNGYQDLVLQHNQGITGMEVEASPHLAARIRTLDLNRNAITSIKDVKKLSGVKFVDGQNCGYHDVPDWIVHLPDLQNFNCNNNPIKTIPTWILSDCNLVVLTFKNCQLEDLPQELFCCSLRDVDISGNPGKTRIRVSRIDIRYRVSKKKNFIYVKKKYTKK